MKPEFKANIVELVLGRLFALFTGDQFRGVVKQFVRRNYNKGMMAREVKLKLNMNPIPNEEKIDVMTDYTSAEITGVMDDLNKQIAQTIREGIMSNENPDDVRKKVKAVLNPTDETTFQYPSGRRVNWRDRITMITRTESARAQNMGHMDTFLQSGLDGKKYLSVHKDDRNLECVCRDLANKYDRDGAIPIDEEFEIKKGKNMYRFQYPPVHPHCRCLVLFRIEGGENT
jgi:hypothetical protein